MVDSKGLITISRGDKLPDHKKSMARADDTPNMKDLRDIIAYVKPHALIGLSGAGPSFEQARGRLRHLACQQKAAWSAAEVL
jgi:malic enzyme